MAGSLYVYHMFIDTYHKPEFGIKETMIDDEIYDVIEEIVKRRNFCDLLHFKKLKCDKELPKILLVAPMSGHYATLLRGTVKDMLPHYDVYITDWKNARDVPLTEGSFDFKRFCAIYDIVYATPWSRIECNGCLPIYRTCISCYSCHVYPR